MEDGQVTKARRADAVPKCGDLINLLLSFAWGGRADEFKAIKTDLRMLPMKTGIVLSSTVADVL
jgi:hypothetical protein